MFRLYRDTGEEEWSIRAEKLLDDIWNGCTEDMSLAYGDGLCGIGAGTEYLIQNGFVEGDADEILAEIDSRVFAAINARPPFDLSIEQEYQDWLVIYTIGFATGRILRNRSC